MFAWFYERFDWTIVKFHTLKVKTFLKKFIRYIGLPLRKFIFSWKLMILDRLLYRIWEYFGYPNILPNSMFNNLICRCPNLEVLWVKHCPKVTDESMGKIALKCPKIMELDISSSYALTRECMGVFGKNCKNLQIVKKNYVYPTEVSRFESHENYMENLSIFTLGNIDAYVISRYMQHVRHLELRFSTMTDKGFASICKHCVNLEYLDLSGSPNLTMDGVINGISILKNLKEIKKPNSTAFFFIDLL